MSKLNEQIKELQNKVKKVEFLNHILDSAKSYEHKDFKDVHKEVVALLSDFVVDSVKAIEDGSSVVKSEGFSTEDIKVLKAMVKRIEKKESLPVKSSQTVQSKNKPVTDNNDKLSFALSNRHLANKRVSVTNSEGMTVLGEVVGLEAPNVVVKTDTGPTIYVPLEKVSLA